MSPRRRRWAGWILLFGLGLGLGGAGLVAAWMFLSDDLVARRARLALDLDIDGEGPAAIAVPEGYEVMPAVRPGLVAHPMYACFDDLGRLYVAVSSGEARGMADRMTNRPDAVHLLEDTDGDGVFDRSRVFADRLTFPQGIAWHDGAVYVASPPALLRLEDTDGDGAADRREEILAGFPFTGIADDLHGPCIGPDGRLYLGIGRFPYNIRRPGSGGETIRRGEAPFILRCRADGGEVEVVSAGMGNPVEVAFTPEGEPLACGTFFARPETGLDRRDAIIHCVQGGLFPVRDRDSREDPSTGDLLPPAVQLGVDAPSGLMLSARDDGDLALYSALYNRHAVHRHALRREGSTFVADDEPFLKSEAADFHPTDVLEDADGSLIVVDTGGWFRACPTSQIARRNVLGGIYRVVDRRATRLDDPRGLALAWDADASDLAARLDDDRPAVRDRAIRALAARGDGAVPALREALASASPRGRRDAVWALCRIDGDEAREAARSALDDDDPGVRLAAATAASLRRDAGAFDRLKAMLDGDNAPLRREAATALGRIGRPEAVPALLDALRVPADRFVDHALIFALISVADREATLAGLDRDESNVRRGALIALDQMRDGGLSIGLVAPLLESPDPALRRSAAGIVASHPQWADDAVALLEPWLVLNPLDDERREFLRQALRALSGGERIRGLIGDTLVRDDVPKSTKVVLLEVVAASEPDETPPGWARGLGLALESADPALIRPAIAGIQALRLTEFDGRLMELARNPRSPSSLRVEAFEAVAPRLSSVDPSMFRFLVRQLGRQESPILRMSAARALGLAPLDSRQLIDLSRPVTQAGALVLPRLLSAYARSESPEVGHRLVRALDQSPGLRSLTPRTLRDALRTYPESILAEAAPLLDRIDLDEGEKAARLAELEPITRRGDAASGRGIFFGTKAACSSCHAIAGEGTAVGPDLSHIGAVRTRADLLEAVVFPSASFARGYEPYTVATRGGEILNGLIRGESAEAVTLTIPGRGDVRLPRRSVEEIQPGQESVMPRGLENNLTSSEFSDLLAFLASLR